MNLNTEVNLCMIDNSHFKFLKEELKCIYDKYDYGYEYLNQMVKENVVNKRFFSGSSEMLCIYEPSLIKGLRCNWSLKGSFKEKKPKSNIYHIISFGDEGKVIKLDFFDDISIGNRTHKEIFFIYDYDQFKTVYLVFDTTMSAQHSKLQDVYMLKYDETGRMIEYVHIPSKALSRDLTGEMYIYNKHNLVESFKYSTWYSEFERYEFEYDDDGYMCSYRQFDLSKNIFYTAKFSKKDIERFEKKGRFYFSPAINY